jgi:hypothetical protein
MATKGTEGTKKEENIIKIFVIFVPSVAIDS